MNRTARVAAIAAVFLLLLTTAVSALDWGGSLTNSTTIQSVPEGSDDRTFVQSNRLTGYVSGGLFRSVYLIQAAVQLADDPVIAADIEKAYLSKTVNLEEGKLLSYRRRIGRFLLSDPTGEVMSQVIDGVAFGFGRQNSEVRIAAGYTGLVSKDFANLSMSKLDGVDDADDDEMYAPARFLGQLVYSRPDVILGQNLTLAVVVQEDLRDPDQAVEDGTTVLDAGANAGGLLDTQYGIVVLDGPLPLPNLFYTAALVINRGRMLSVIDVVEFGSTYQYEPISAHLVKLNAQYYMPWLFSSRLSGGVTLSSGDTDFSGFVEGNTNGDANQFIPVNPGSTGAVFGLQAGNSTITEISFASQPFVGNPIPLLDKFQGVVSMYQFYRSAGEGPVSSSDVDAATSGSYLGTEVDFSARFRPFSDLGLGVSGGLLMKNEDVLPAGAEASDFVLRLSASLSF